MDTINHTIDKLKLLNNERNQLTKQLHETIQYLMFDYDFYLIEIGNIRHDIKCIDDSINEILQNLQAIT